MIDQKNILFFLLLAALLVFTNCECGDDEDENTPVPQKVWEDSVSGLMWQNNILSVKKSHESGIKYCKDLSWAGYADWRLPSISELRTLIRGCEPTETGGECKVADDCLTEESCYDKKCTGCKWTSGPGIDGFHWPPELTHNLPDDNYLSSSEVIDYEMVESEYMIWVIGFQNGRIFSFYNGLWNTRCVRNGPLAKDKFF